MKLFIELFCGFGDTVCRYQCLNFYGAKCNNKWNIL